MEKSEQEKFLEGLTQDETVDVFAQPTEETGATGEDEPRKQEETDETKLRNRRERRLAEKLEAERRAGIELAAKYNALSEAQKANQTPGEDYLARIEKIYGTASPEAREATELLKNTLRDVGENATKRALEIFREEQRQEKEQIKQEEAKLNAILEEIEEDYGVDVTENDKTRTAYLKLLEKMSPKDEDGNIVQYADHHAVWEVFQSRKAKPDTRAKDLADRTMVESGASKESTIQQDATTRYLIEKGFI